jgi:formylglycine-generating enzyme required for sulfatase activity
MANYALLFVGFGMRDDYVLRLLHEVLAVFGGALQSSYALMKRGELRARELWDEHNVHVIEFDDYGEAQIRLIERLATAARERQKEIVDNNSSSEHVIRRRRMIPQPYLEWLQKQCVDIDLLGMRVKHTHRVRLDSIYVPLTTMVAVPADATSRQKPTSERNEYQDAKPELLLNVLDQQSLYVTGDPGSGKSVFCRWVSFLACNPRVPVADIQGSATFRESAGESFHRRLPLLIRLRQFWQHLPARADIDHLSQQDLEQSLAAWLEVTQVKAINAWDIEAHCERGTLLLVMDGLDEVPNSCEFGNHIWSPRTLLLSTLKTTLAHWIRRGNRILVTSRPHGLDEAEVQAMGLAHVKIGPLPLSLQELLVIRWFSVMEGNTEEGRSTGHDMLRHLRGIEGMNLLAANPLLLTAACIVFNEGKRLPQDKYELYDRIVDTVLYHRYPDDSNMVEIVRGRLGAVALSMHTGDALGEARDDPLPKVSFQQLDRILEVYRQKSPETEADQKDTLRTRDSLLSRSGLFVPAEPKQAEFYHLSLQEFLAAERLARLNRTDDGLASIYLRYSAYPSWRSTLSFLSACQISRMSWEAGVKLLGRLLDNVDLRNMERTLGLSLGAVDTMYILLGRNLRLRESLIDRLRQVCVAALNQEVDLQPRVEFGTALGQLGDPRLLKDLRDHNDSHAWVEVPVGECTVGVDQPVEFDGFLYELKKQVLVLKRPFRLTRYLVTNSQFDCFIKEGGYENAEYWSEQGWDWRHAKAVNEPAFWHDPKWNGPNQPVVGVSFWEAEAFATWAGGELPDEKHWEAAAAGPSGLDYPWGNKFPDAVCNTKEVHLDRTSPVGLFPSSRSVPFGFEDMAGNVWEWCANQDLARLRGETEKEQVQVVRGGSWSYIGEYARNSFRNWGRPFTRNVNQGFRVLLFERDEL